MFTACSAVHQNFIIFFKHLTAKFVSFVYVSFLMNNKQGARNTGNNYKSVVFCININYILIASLAEYICIYGCIHSVIRKSLPCSGRVVVHFKQWSGNCLKNNKANHKRAYAPDVFSILQYILPNSTQVIQSCNFPKAQPPKKKRWENILNIYKRKL